MTARGIGSRQPGANRRNWMAPVLMIAAALSIAIVSYSISMKVSAERASTERLVRENAVLAEELSRLEAELRVRARLPQLERWNGSVLGLKPIEARQFLADPLHLARYGTPLESDAAAMPALAVMHDAPRAGEPVAAGALVRTVSAPRPTAQVTGSATAAAPAARASAIDPALVAMVEALAADPAPRRPSLSTVALDAGVAPPGPREGP